MAPQLRRVPADGNCFFHAAICSARSREIWPPSVGSVRRADARICAATRQSSAFRALAAKLHPSAPCEREEASPGVLQWCRLVAAATLLLDEDLRSFCSAPLNEILRECATMGSFVDHVHIHAFVEGTGIPLRILRRDSRSEVRIVPRRVSAALASAGVARRPRHAIVLYDAARVHYDAIVVVREPK